MTNDEQGMRRGADPRLLRSAAIWVAVYVIFQVIFRHVQLPRTTPIPVIQTVYIGSIALFMLLTIVMTAALARSFTARRTAWLAIALGAAGWLAALAIGRWVLPPPAAGGARPPRPDELRMLLGQVVDVSRAIAAAGLGAWGATLIREKNILLPAAIFAAFADYMMVNFGTVHMALNTEKGQKVVSAMSSSAPSIQVGGVPIIAPTVGMADFVAIAFVVVCALRFGLNLTGTMVAFAVVLTAALVYVSLTGNPVPALAPMAIAFVAVNARRFKLSRSEMQAVIVVFALVAALTAAFFAMRTTGR